MIRAISEIPKQEMLLVGLGSLVLYISLLHCDQQDSVS